MKQLKSYLRSQVNHDTKMKSISAKVLLLLLLFPAIAISAEPDRQAIEKEVFAVLDKFMLSFNAMDPVAHVTTYHFPHFRLARGSMKSWETEKEVIETHKRIFKALPATGWHKSSWVHRKIISLSESKVHVDTQFRRVRKDGTEIKTARSLYVLIKVDGKWGIKLRSSFL